LAVDDAMKIVGAPYVGGLQNRSPGVPLLRATTALDDGESYMQAVYAGRVHKYLRHGKCCLPRIGAQIRLLT
jgi:hypothetical protein